MYSQTCQETSQGSDKMWSHKTGGLLTQLIYSEKYTFGGLKGQSLNTGSL